MRLAGKIVDNLSNHRSPPPPHVKFEIVHDLFMVCYVLLRLRFLKRINFRIIIFHYLCYLECRVLLGIHCLHCFID